MQPGLIEAILLGLAVFVILRLVMGNKPRPGDSRDIDVSPEDSQPSEQNRPDPREMAARYWDFLRGDAPAANSAPDVQSAALSQGFDAKEFLAGAKAVYARLFESWTKNDITDMGQFATQNGLDKLRTRFDFLGQSGKPRILLLEASMLHSVKQENVTKAEVEYKVLFGLENAPNQEIRDILSFVRDDATPGATWLLDNVRPAGT